MRKVFAVLILVYLIVSRVSAQSSYPIYVSPSLTPPYSLKLSDYSKFGSQQLVVNVAVNDLSVSNLPVKLHIRFETVGVTIENIPNLSTTPIYLDGGAASILFGDDLKDYFDINNLVFKGYSKEAYRRTGQLPEGFYRISVEVRHFQTNRLISNLGTASAWIAIGKPPLLKLPENNKELGEFKGMPLVFSWYPINLGSPVSARSVQYKLELWELRIEGVSPYTVAATVPNFYEETTQNTMLSVLPASMLMTPGMKYAWRVTASDQSGFVPFEQDGHSEIRVFTYRSKCEAAKNLKSKLRGVNGFFAWEPARNHTSYNVELRRPETGWLAASETFDSKAELFDLDYGATYELRVQSVCDNDPSMVSDFTGWEKLKTPEKRTRPDSTTCPSCGCGTPNGTGNIENIELKRDLKPGDTLINRFGTTRFILKSVEQTGDGVYKGQFYFWAEIWKLKFICEYWDLSANTDRVILNMDFQSVYNPQFLLDVDATTDYLNGLADAIAVLTANAKITDTLSVNENVLSYYVSDNGELIAVTIGENGEYKEVVVKADVDDAEETLIKGVNGEECVVTKNGEVMGVKEYKRTGGGNGRLIEKYIAENEKNNLTNDVQVNFSASQSQKYGFDAFTGEKETIKAKYPALGNGYVPAFKSIASFALDKVVPTHSTSSGQGSTGNGITFRDGMGIPAIKSGDELTIRGGADGTVTALYAYKSVSDTSEKIAGKLNLMSFDEQVKRLYIVPVNGAKLPDVTELQNVLNKIYAQAVTRWEVVKIDKNVELTFPNGQMEHGGSSAIAVYNADQKNIISKFKETDNFEKDALYLFFVDNVKGKTGDVAGFMPLQRQAGFIYDSPNLFIIAHELAHGAFNLRHTFSPEEFIAAERTTQNLMDYKGGSELWKHQWELIRDPQTMLFAWAQDEREGEYTQTPIDKQHTLLFDHIFDNNHIGTMNYLNSIDKAIASGNNDAINLSYTEDEAKKWNATEKTWIDQWKIRVMNSDDVFSDVIKSIKDAEKDEKISKIVLRPKHIYIGKYKFEDVEYPVAIYGNGENTVMTNAFTKIQVTDSKELEDKEKKKYIYCDETILNYLVIAFYEDGRTDPSMIMQIEKFDISKMQNTKDKWLEFLGVLIKTTSTTSRNCNLKLYDGDKEKVENSIFTITANPPTMPDVRVSAESKDTIKLRLKIVFNARKSWTDTRTYTNELVRDDVTWFPNNGWQDVKSGEKWDIDFGNSFRGGKAYLFCKIKNTIVDTIIFHIRGENPSEEDVHNYINSLQNADGWYVPKMIRQESSFHQFNPGVPTSTGQLAGMPNWGPPYGWGLKMLDNLGVQYGYRTVLNGAVVREGGASPDELWNWQLNVRKGIQFFNGAKMPIAVSRWTSAITEISLWERTHQAVVQNAYPMVIIESPIATELNTTVNEIVVGNATNSETIVSNPNPTGSQRSLTIAHAIKFYNGGNNYFTIVIPVNQGRGEAETPKWNINKLGNGRDYVNDISGRAGW